MLAFMHMFQYLADSIHIILKALVLNPGHTLQLPREVLKCSSSEGPGFGFYTALPKGH